VAELDRASPRGASRTLAATIRTSALVELGRTTEAREVFDAELGKRPMPRDFQLAILSRLAEARLRAAEGDRTGAAQLLARLADDIRAGSGIRERARSLAAQLS
jgi:hypothetical protein